MKCDRCGLVEGTYPITWTDEIGEEREGKICWDCDFDISNGRGDMETDPYDIHIQRLSDAYNEDPVNNSHLAKYAM